MRFNDHFNVIKWLELTLSSFFSTFSMIRRLCVSNCALILVSDEKSRLRTIGDKQLNTIAMAVQTYFIIAF